MLVTFVRLVFMPHCVLCVSLLNSVRSLLDESDQQLYFQLRNTPLIRQDYDFIIVGGGSAGCVVASRLSENPFWKVLLIEAGGPQEFYTDIPIMVGTLPGTHLDWGYLMEESPNYCRAYKTNRCSATRAKVLGGNSVFNYMVATRGNRKDYDGWAALGNKGWSYDEVLPYFIKFENMTIPHLRESRFHGKEGPVTIKETNYHSVLAKAFLEAGKELGHEIGDYNGQNQAIFSYFQFNQNEQGRRQSMPRAYLFPVLQKRKNLHVLTNTFVRKILFRTNQAYAVVVELDGSMIELQATKEIIVSGGAINSPQLLMLSGIGPKDHLTEIGIPVVKDLPVGLNFQDHVSFGSVIFITNATENELQTNCLLNDPKFFINYVEKGYGPYELPGGNEGVYFFDSIAPKDAGGFPDVEIHFSSITPIPAPGPKDLKPEFSKIFEPLKDKATFSLTLRLMRPKSVGYIQLRGKDPHLPPKIVPNYFQNPEDLKISLKGLRKAFEISQTRAFQKYGTHFNAVPVPGCDNEEFQSDDYWMCVMRIWTEANHHESSTCQMSPKGVVDERLRVHGIEGLRVIDGSIFPTVPSCHNNLPTIMTAEKGADMIKEDHQF